MLIVFFNYLSLSLSINPLSLMPVLALGCICILTGYSQLFFFLFSERTALPVTVYFLQSFLHCISSISHYITLSHLFLHHETPSIPVMYPHHLMLDPNPSLSPLPLLLPNFHPFHLVRFIYYPIRSPPVFLPFSTLFFYLHS